MQIKRDRQKTKAVQGNIDPCAFAGRRDWEESSGHIIKGEKRKRTLFNLEHGILPETPVKNAIAAVEAVHKYSKWR